MTTDHHNDQDHAAVINDSFWHARHGSSTTSPTTTPTTATSEDDEPGADERERERGEGVSVEDVVRFLDEVIEAGEGGDGGG